MSEMQAYHLLPEPKSDKRYERIPFHIYKKYFTQFCKQYTQLIKLKINFVFDFAALQYLT